MTDFTKDVRMETPSAKPRKYFTLGKKSLGKLQGVHPDLAKVVKRAIQTTTQDFSVIEGMRTLKRQKTLVAKGASTTMNSRHLTGHAVDIAPYPFKGDVDEDGIINIEDWDQYYPLAEAMKSAAKEFGVEITWGGDWKSFKDGPHYQLSWSHYPK